MSLWQAAGVNQWRDTEDPEQHLLVKVGTDYKELAGRWVHRYTGPAVVANPVWPLGDPNADPALPPVCQWRSTQELADAPTGTLAQVFAWLTGLQLPKQ